MPAHNEAALVAASVDAVVEGLRARGEEFEILVVENGSTDATALIVADLAEREPALLVRSLAVADYGAAILEGIVRAHGDVVVLFDVDYYDLDFLDRAVARLRAPAPGDSPAAVVVGSKRAPGTVDSRPWPRRFVTATFATVLRVGFGLSVSDTHGMKVMRRSDVEPLARRCRTRADLFDTELVLRVERAGLGVAELPVTVRELRPSRTPIARRALRTVVGLVRLRLVLLSESRRGSGNRAGAGV
jgi:glycosyltransferase involved in cell wall biosynthesis